jgi:hypothetical protein
MTENATPASPGDQTPEKEHVGGELVIPIAGVLFAIYYFSTIIDSPWTAQVSAIFVGSILIFLVAILLIKTAVRMKKGQVDLGLDTLTRPASYVPKRLKLLGLTIGYIVIVQYAGFTITTFIFLALSMLVLTDGRNKVSITVMSAFIALGGWALFIYAFNTRFPAGPFETMMKGLL